MAIISLANLKGGVGQSTLAVNIAGALAPKSVLMDADPPATATSWGEAGHLPFRVVSAPLTGRNVQGWLGTVLALDAGFVVIDQPPMLGEATTAALAICDLAVVPVSPSGADLRATNRVVELIREARTARKDGRLAALLVPSKVDRRTRSRRGDRGRPARLWQARGAGHAQRIAHVDAFSAGQWIGDYAKGSAGHSEVKALAVVKRLAGGKR